MTAPDAARTEDVLRALGEGVRRAVARRVPEPDVEDVVQEAFLRIHRGLGALEDEERLAGWVHRVAASAVADYHRRRPREEGLGAEPAAAEVEDARATAREVAGWLRPMLFALSDDEREALELVELEGLSQRALAERLGLSPSGARTRVQRARASLRDVLTRCCAIELDARRQVIDYRLRDRPSSGCACGEG